MFDNHTHVPVIPVDSGGNIGDCTVILYDYQNNELEMDYDA